MTDAAATDSDLEGADRPDLTELGAEQIAPIESRVAGWPESWCGLARSMYVTLIVRAAPLPPDEAVALATELVRGIAADMGGTQPYINQGAELARNGKIAHVVRLLEQHRQDYDRVAQLVGLSARQVYRIEARWLRAERARRQATLPLDE